MSQRHVLKLTEEIRYSWPESLELSWTPFFCSCHKENPPWNPIGFTFDYIPNLTTLNSSTAYQLISYLLPAFSTSTLASQTVASHFPCGFSNMMDYFHLRAFAKPGLAWLTFSCLRLCLNVIFSVRSTLSSLLIIPTLPHAFFLYLVPFF